MLIGFNVWMSVLLFDMMCYMVYLPQHTLLYDFCGVCDGSSICTKLTIIKVHMEQIRWSHSLIRVMAASSTDSSIDSTPKNIRVVYHTPTERCIRPHVR